MLPRNRKSVSWYSRGIFGWKFSNTFRSVKFVLASFRFSPYSPPQAKFYPMFVPFRGYRFSVCGTLLRVRDRNRHPRPQPRVLREVAGRQPEKVAEPPSSRSTEPEGVFKESKATEPTTRIDIYAPAPCPKYLPTIGLRRSSVAAGISLRSVMIAIASAWLHLHECSFGIAATAASPRCTHSARSW